MEVWGKVAKCQSLLLNETSNHIGNIPPSYTPNGPECTSECATQRDFGRGTDEILDHRGEKPFHGCTVKAFLSNGPQP